MSSELIAGVATAVVMILGFLGIQAKFQKIVLALKEGTDVVQAFQKAVADGKISSNEVDLIIEEINEAKGALRDVFVKKDE